MYKEVKGSEVKVGLMSISSLCVKPELKTKFNVDLGEVINLKSKFEFNISFHQAFIKYILQEISLDSFKRISKNYT